MDRESAFFRTLVDFGVASASKLVSFGLMFAVFLFPGNAFLQEYVTYDRTPERVAQKPAPPEEPALVGPETPFHDGTVYLTSIYAGFQMIDKICGWALRKIGKKPKLVSKTLGEGGEYLIFESRGRSQTFRAEQVNRFKFDEIRYKALESSLGTNWKLYHDCYEGLPLESGYKRAQLTLQIEALAKQICAELWEMVEISERALQADLSEYHSVEMFCGATVVSRQ